MLDYKNIIIKRYPLNLSFKQLAEEFNASKSVVNDGSLPVADISWRKVGVKNSRR